MHSDTLSTNSAVQRLTAVAAYLESKQLLLFVFVQPYHGLEGQTSVTTQLQSKQLLMHRHTLAWRAGALG